MAHQDRGSAVIKQAAQTNKLGRATILVIVLTLVTMALLLTGSRITDPRAWLIYPLLLPTLAAALYVYRHSRLLKPAITTYLAILVLAMSSVDMADVFAHASPNVTHWLATVISNPTTTSYYADAMRLRVQPGWIANFQNEPLYLHSSTHPVGPILFYAFLIELFGPLRTTLIAPLLIAALSALSVLSMYLFSGIWSPSRRDRLIACVLWSLCPGMGLVFPELDQIYPALSMLILASAYFSLTKNLRYAWLFGFSLFLGTLLAYNLLVLSTFLGRVNTNSVIIGVNGDHG